MQNISSLFIPAADPASRRLMVVLHGLGDSLDSYQTLPAENRIVNARAVSLRRLQIL